MRVLIVSLVAAAVALGSSWASAGNQERAERIAAGLRESGQLKGYKITVKYQDGVAWLNGTVTSREQMAKALAIPFQTEGVTHVVNELKVAPAPAGGATLVQRLNRLRQGKGLSQIDGALGAERSVGTIEQVTANEPAPLPSDLSAQRSTRQRGSLASMQVAAPIPPAPVAPGAPVAPAPAGVQGPPLPIGAAGGMPMQQYAAPMGTQTLGQNYDRPTMPNYAWPSYAAYPNYAAVTYPKQYSPTAWPYIGPFYPYPQVPLEWRKVTLQWHDGWWFLDFNDCPRDEGPLGGLFHPFRKSP